MHVSLPKMKLQHRQELQDTLTDMGESRFQKDAAAEAMPMQPSSVCNSSFCQASALYFLPPTSLGSLTSP